MIKKNIFREYDIRGIYPTELNEETAYLFGKAFGKKIIEQEKNEALIGYDNRLSSKSLYDNIIKGLLETGINITSLGLVTTPMYYYGRDLLNIDCGVMITASHNPKEYNGFKFCYNKNHNAYGKDVYEIYDIILDNKWTSVGKGSIKEVDVSSEYVNLLLKEIKLTKKPLKVIYDCGNGTTSIIANQVFSKLNIECIPLFDISNGNFPNHHPDPCEEENMTFLKKEVIKNKADLGIGFDGDGDRIGVIDEKGNMIPIDKLMIIVWRYIYNKISDKRGLFDVKCSKCLEDEMKKLNIEPIQYRTGNSYTKAKMVSENLPFGGELSGHIYFQDKFPGYDDGIYAGLRIIEILSNTNKKISELLDGINTYYNTPEIKIKVRDEIKEKIIENIKNYTINKKYNILTIDGIKVIFDDGFALIRASNTGPNITIRYEAKTTERLKEISDEFNNLLDVELKINNQKLNENNTS